MLKQTFKNIIPQYILTGIKEAKWEKLQHQKLEIGKKQAELLLKENQDIKIDIGSGARKGNNGWTTVDICEGCDLFWNILLPFPFPDNSINQIYSSHVLEHFYYKDTLKIIKECYRLLKPNSIFRVCVPNAKIYINAYLNQEKFNLNDMENSPYFDRTNTNIDYINFMAYMGGEHKYLFDEENLLAVLKQGGFNDVKLSSFDGSIDLSSREKESIYAIAIK
jgi:predicted SAM-dependent methyltransferase